MDWLNIYGLIIVIIIMIPNIVYGIKTSANKKTAKWIAPKIEKMEQIGRYGCIAFMIFNVSKVSKGFWFEGGFTVYIAVNVCLITAYCLAWVLMFSKISITRSLILSIIPSVIFLFSGILQGSVLLMISAVLFAISHIMISYKNTFYQLMELSDSDNK